MYQRIQLGLVAVMAALFVLTVLSRRFPQAGWLSPFRVLFPAPTEAERARARRVSDFDAGLKFILLGLGIGVLYVASRIMLFEDLGGTGAVAAAIAATSCVALGILAIRQSRRG